MAFQFNPITGTLDLVGSGGDVFGPGSSTDRAIASWNGTTGTLLRDNPRTKIQDSGAIQAQAFITSRVIDGVVNIPTDYTWIAPSLELTITGSIEIESGAELIIV